jgi:hypothetical protein
MAYLNMTLDELPEDDFQPLPAGIYKAQIVTDDIKSTKNGSGKYLEIQWEVIEGDQSGRKVFDRLHMWNQNSTAVSIAGQTLRKIWEAVNASKVAQGKQPIHAFDNTEHLYFTPVLIDVRIKKGTGEYADSNEIKGYKPVASGAPAAPPAPPRPAQPSPVPSGPPQAPAASNGANPFPWQR